MVGRRSALITFGTWEISLSNPTGTENIQRRVSWGVKRLKRGSLRAEQRDSGIHANLLLGTTMESGGGDLPTIGANGLLRLRSGLSVLPNYGQKAPGLKRPKQGQKKGKEQKSDFTVKEVARKGCFIRLTTRQADGLSGERNS